MSVLFRCRVDAALLAKANRVTQKLGTSTPEMFRMFVAQIARTGRVPISLQVGSDDALAGPWSERAQVIERFYDKSKTW